MLKVHKLTLGFLDTHCYIVGDTEAGSCIVIDPAYDAPRILDVVQSEGWTVKYIVATHCHIDHIMALNEVKAATGAPFGYHELDKPVWDRYVRMVAYYAGIQVEPAVPADWFIPSGAVIEQDAIRLEARFTPGHAPGHLSFVSHELRSVFGGDVLFRGMVGRWDLDGSNRDDLFHSITTQLLTLPDDYLLLAGHGDETTIGTERRENRYVVEWLESHTQ